MKFPLPRPAIFFFLLWWQYIDRGVWCNQGDGSSD